MVDVDALVQAGPLPTAEPTLDQRVTGAGRDDLPAGDHAVLVAQVPRDRGLTTITRPAGDPLRSARQVPGPLTWRR